MKSMLIALARFLSRAGKDRREPRSRQVTLTLEALEPRDVPQATPATDPFLFTPLPETTPLVLHIHQHLTILINGHRRGIPALIGFRPPVGFLPIHTHDTSGIIHVESSEVRTFTLGDFFAVWGQPFNAQQILGKHADATHKITMTVDGRVRRSFENWVLHDHDDIVISYRRRSAPPPVVAPFVWPFGF
jgi:hypothetical protein